MTANFSAPNFAAPNLASFKAPVSPALTAAPTVPRVSSPLPPADRWTIADLDHLNALQSPPSIAPCKVNLVQMYYFGDRKKLGFGEFCDRYVCADND
ncbi:MAG: hypothetical protein ACO4AI_06115 [Prochlorothrix sp.]